MNIVKKLTLRHLKENKSRTIITTLGICVSVAMITAVFVSVASFMKFYGDAVVFENGNKHAEYYALSNEQVSALKADDRIDEIGLYANLPEEADGFKLESEASLSNRVGNIYAGDETNLKQMLTGKIDGNMPRNEKEIAVEQALIDKNKLDWKIGDTVTIQLGERYYEYDYEEHDYDNDTSKTIRQRDHIYGSYGVSYEEFVPAHQAEFKIVGILHNNNPTYNKGKIVRGLSDAEKKAEVNATILLKNVNYKSLEVLEDISKTIGVEYGSDQMNINKDYLQSNLAIDSESIIATALIPMALVILVIIMIASVVLIYNSFGMSLSERTRYLGMLGSVGATKRQKKQSVYFEGAFLGLIGIPLGIIGGVIGIGVTLEIVGQRIIETGMLMGIEDSSVEFKAVVPAWAVVGVVLFSLITIFISAVIPARKASAITPVEALRQSTEIKIKAKKVRSPKYIRKIFGYEGELAHKNLKRNGRKSRVITASIAVSIILFLSVSYFCDMFTRVNDEMDYPFQIQMYVDYDKMDEIAKDIRDIDAVDDVYGLNQDQFYIGKNIKIDYDNALGSAEYLTNTYKDFWNLDRALFVFGLEDETFNQLCKDNGVDYKEYYNLGKDNAKILLLNNVSRKTGGAGVFNEKAIGSRMEYGSNSDGTKNYYYQVQDLIDYKSDNKFFSLAAKGYLEAYIPYSVWCNFYDEVNETPDIQHDILLCVETSKHSDVTEKLQNYFEENNMSTTVFDIAANMESMKTIIFVLQVFVYGFITLITMITIANIINTISTSIALRRKEFAMLKSVGTTQKGFYKMVCLESVFYGLNALLAGLPLSVLISFGLNKLLGEDHIPFEIDFVMYGCVILAVFLIIGFSMLYSVKKIKKDSIIETLKQDIT
ncbi:MAG: ABC transporter permease [Eubacterium sp.]|nr:ABC transporter permease [Eubacterium sp.]